ncbi:MAG: 3-phosphoshikimate 1-carboxyvinyltransferase [Lachnospiraceae bacterium]|nr:3-phosphoshikimate 1-carboxyvinyltransferase [Lachnospiraceae bacterium]
MDKEIIYGNRIYLRPITEADTEMVLEWRNCERTVRNFYYRKPITAEEHADWLKNKVDAGQVWQYIVCLKEGDAPIGSVYLQHFDPATMTGESGVFFSEDAPAGQGLATEAVKLIGEETGFKKLGLLHITAKVISTNAASIKLHENAGYRVVRTECGEKCSDGDVVDSLWFVKDAPVYSFDRKPLLKAHTGKITEEADGTLSITVPGSKSITNRALLAAMLAEGESLLEGALFSDDTESLLNCMESLGIRTETDREACTIRVYGCGGRIPNKEASLNVGSAGTAARFLTAVLGATDGGIYHMDSSDQMKKRPMASLLDCLKELGCEVVYEGVEGFFPFTIKPHGFNKDEVCVDIGKSSQFLSALIIAAPLSGRDIRLRMGSIAANLSYVEITRKVLESFGIASEKLIEDTEKNVPFSTGEKFTSKGHVGYIVKSGIPKAAEYLIEPDASAAAYFYALSPLVGRPVTVKGLGWDTMQDDIRFIDALHRLGLAANVSETGDFKVVPLSGKPEKIVPMPPGRDVKETDAQLPGNTKIIYMTACSDQTMTLAALVPYYGKPLTIMCSSHLRLQESDREAAIINELERAGYSTELRCDNDAIYIKSGSLKPAEIETYGDHRMAMAFSLLGIKEKGISILDPSCCSKTFPDYFAYLDEILSIIR